MINHHWHGSYLWLYYKSLERNICERDIVKGPVCVFVRENVLGVSERAFIIESSMWIRYIFVGVSDKKVTYLVEDIGVNYIWII